MKKYFIIIVSAVVLASCSEFLDTAPSDQVSTSTMWTTESLADKGMAGLYRVFYTSSNADTGNCEINSSFSGICRQEWMGMEFQSDNIQSNGLYALTYATKRATEPAITVEWSFGYTGIHRVNDALENLHKAGLSEEKYERYMCEAKFLRAFFYTRLNQIFQGVPIYLETIDDSECTKGQSTSAEVWQVVIDDLTDCVNNQYFPDNTLNQNGNYGRPSKGAAYSLRGLAYMYLAWENGESNTYYQLAANDFEKVAQCGYGLWQGRYIDFFLAANEKSQEMIFPLQFTGDSGFSDYLQILVAGRESYDGWSHIRPSFPFVSYYQNADGSDFNWEDKVPGWDDDVFVQDVRRREVFFIRDSVAIDNSGKVLDEGRWTDTDVASLQNCVDNVGIDVFNKYYMYIGNEDRIKEAFNDRDPRLKQTILTPYDKYNTLRGSSYNNGMVQYDKEKRHPYLDHGSGDGTDYYCGVQKEDTYVYKKFVHTGEEGMELVSRNRGYLDWPLIRYTDVYLHLAECYVHLGQLSNAVEIVNQIRSRAEMPSISAGSADDVMEAIRYERRVELCAEGVCYFDEWRWGTYKKMKFQDHDVYGDANYWGHWDGYWWTWYYDDCMYPWSAPGDECDRNPNLTRRDGWAY